MTTTQGGHTAARQPSAAALTLAIGILLLGLAGVLATVSIFLIDATASTCNYTACDPGWSLQIFVVATIVIGTLLLAGAWWMFFGTPRAHVVRRAGITLVVLAAACFLAVGIYSGAGPVNF